MPFKAKEAFYELESIRQYIKDSRAMLWMDIEFLCSHMIILSKLSYGIHVLRVCQQRRQ